MEFKTGTLIEIIDVDYWNSEAPEQEIIKLDPVFFLDNSYPPHIEKWRIAAKMEDGKHRFIKVLKLNGEIEHYDRPFWDWREFIHD